MTSYDPGVNEIPLPTETVLTDGTDSGTRVEAGVSPEYRDTGITAYDPNMIKVICILQEMLTIQKGALKLLESTLGDDISGRDELNGDL